MPVSIQITFSEIKFEDCLGKYIHTEIAEITCSCHNTR